MSRRPPISTRTDTPIPSTTLCRSDDWDEQFEKLQAFGSSVMLMSGRYKGQPMAAHLRHDGAMTAANFDRWRALWRETTDDILDPKNAFVLQEKAARIAESLQLGVKFQRERLVSS